MKMSAALMMVIILVKEHAPWQSPAFDMPDRAFLSRA